MAEDSIIKPMLQSTTKEINKNLKGDINALKKQASSFLKGVRNIVQEYSSIRVLVKRTKTGIGSSLSQVYQALKKNTINTQKCIKLQYDFETALNQFLGRQILLLYVDAKGKMLYASEATAAKIYQTAVATEEGKKGSIDRDLSSELKDWPIEISEDYKKLIIYRQNYYKAIRDEVLDRWYDNHNSDNPWVKENSKLLDTFYWYTTITNNKKQWEWSKSINRGHIYEAYANLIWQQRSIVNFDDNEPGEQDVKRYWDYMQSHKILNSVAGIVEGDVSFFLDPSIQFAVKSGAFNTAAMGSYLIVAYQLAYGTIDINKTNVLTLLGNLQSYSKIVRDSGLEAAEERLEKQIAKIQK